MITCQKKEQRMRRTLVSSLWLATLLLMSLAHPAAAHSNLVVSSPMADERLAASPETIILVFDEELAEDTSSFQLLDADGQPVAGVTGSIDLTDPDHRRLIAGNVPPLSEGVYIVRWRALSTDGDDSVTEGEFDFIVGNAAPRVKLTVTAVPAAAPVAITATPSPGPEASPASESSWLPFAIAGGIGIVLAIMAIGLIRGGRS